MTTTTPECRCLNCGREFNSAIGAGTPAPGDLTICLDCGTVMMYAEDLTVRGTCEQANPPNSIKFVVRKDGEL